MIEFTYSQIGEGLIQTLIQKVDRGESVVLLGPRFGGKRSTLYQLRASLNKEDCSNVILLRFCGKNNVSNAAELDNAILRAINRAKPSPGENELVPDATPVNALKDGFTQLDHLYRKTAKPLILLVSNVDSIPQHLARRFLENIQARVDKKTLIAVMSGEYDFRDLVHGPNSPFRCSNLIVLQGYDEAEFKKFFEQYANTLQLHFEAKEEACHKLWQWAGGNTYLLRHFFSSVMERRARKAIPVEEAISVEDYRDLPGNNAVAGAYWTQSFRHANQLIAREPDCWGTLHALLQDGVRELPAANALPSTLELAGVAIRQGKYMKLASPWMEALVRNHFNELRWADLAAKHRKWDEAFARYAELPVEKLLRPTDLDDRLEVEAALRALYSSLYITASSGMDDRKAPSEVVQEINNLFSHGCRLLLGFPEVSFWRSERKKAFQLVGNIPNAELAQLVNATVSPAAPPPLGFLQLPQPASLSAVAARLESIRSDHIDLVVIGDFTQCTAISPEREYLVRELIQHFVAAHAHAVRVSRDRLRLERRNHYFKIANDILNELGRDVRDVRQIMAMASSRLHELGFGRLMFSLVDRGEQMIKGVFDDDPKLDISQLSAWPLIRSIAKPEQSQWDIQQLVVYDKQFRIVENARTDPLTYKKIATVAGQKAIAVIPILDRYEEPIGTIHVERVNREEVLSPGEAEELKEFGRQLAVAIEKIERVTLLESTLDETPEPMIIINAEEKLQYLNRPAAGLFNIRAGWRDYSNAEAINEILDEEGVGFVRQALGGQRNSHLIRKVANKEFTGSWLADCIPDWREHRPLWQGKKAGAWTHIQDLNYLFKVLLAFQKIAAAQDLESAEEASLEATKLLGHTWGRLWLIDEKDPHLLTGRRCYHTSNAEVEERFNNARKELPAKGTDNHTWLCLDNKEPVVLCYKPELPDGSARKTRLGVPYRTVKKAHLTEEFGKNPGDFWLDLPLRANNAPLGKISLQCDENLRQETFELLKVLSSITAEQLEAIRERDRLTNELKDSIRIEVAEKNMADMAHNIATRFNSLNYLLGRYRNREKRWPELKELNDWFFQLMEDLDTAVLRAKEMLADINPIVARINVVNLVKNVLEKSVPEGVLNFEPGIEALSIDADAHYFEMAILELVANSRDFAATEPPLQIRVAIRQEDPGSVQIIYEDNGPGITEDSKKRLFDRFYSHRPGRKQGLGLGLNYVRRVIQAHKGSTLEEGIPGQGVKFLLELPVTKAGNP